jgi:hypothetical protein
VIKRPIFLHQNDDVLGIQIRAALRWINGEGPLNRFRQHACHTAARGQQKRFLKKISTRVHDLSFHQRLRDEKKNSRLPIDFSEFFLQHRCGPEKSSLLPSAPHMLIPENHLRLQLRALGPPSLPQVAEKNLTTTISWTQKFLSFDVIQGLRRGWFHGVEGASLVLGVFAGSANGSCKVKKA